MIKHSQKFFARAATQKTASMWEGMKSVAQRPEFIFGAGTMAVGAAANAIRDAYTATRDAKDKANTYKEMIALHPHLSRMDPAQLHRTFNAIYNTNPYIGKDPTLAGAAVDVAIERQGTYGGPDAKSHQGLLSLVQEFAGSRGQISAARRAESEVGRRGVDFSAAAHGLDKMFQAAHATAEKEHGQVADLKRENAHLTEGIRQRAAEDQFARVTGVKSRPEYVEAVLDAAGHYESNPAIAALAHEMANNPGRIQEILAAHRAKQNPQP